MLPKVWNIPIVLFFSFFFHFFFHWWPAPFKVVVLLMLMAQVLAQDAIIDYVADDHKHTQTGYAGNAVRGSYRWIKSNPSSPYLTGCESAENKLTQCLGSFLVSYIDADGQEYTVNYVADENGYRAEGSHLPGSLKQDPVQASSVRSSVVVKPSTLPKVIPYPLYRPSYRRQLDFNYGYEYPINYPSRYVYDPRYTYLFWCSGLTSSSFYCLYLLFPYTKKFSISLSINDFLMM